ncbi:MAG: protein-methionine-sulfoxide reductase heme-binding subunit MsrQ [Dehalococcoidales bacterium]|nr:protein-methionine-sulfoxide reductase heme-binding subunit MsrQ [Dehalococcoidales bacterium]
MAWWRTNGLRVLVHAGALLPLAWIAWRFTQGNLTANPIGEIQLETGRITLTLLMLSLACTPVYNATGFVPVRQWRRTIGLYAFMYAGLHLLNFVGLDYGFNFPQIWAAIADKKFPMAGLAAFVILVPIAVTSTKGWVERLGKNWKRLHRLVYAAVAIGVIHYVWAAKSQASMNVPLIYGTVLAVLLIVRIPVVKNLISNRVT